MVKKKEEGTWRLVVDFRHLNAITLKSKYPLPMIDELLDELAGACWFTKMVLKAGFHQIRLAPGEEYKTTFQTHHEKIRYYYILKLFPFSLKGDAKIWFNTLAPGCVCSPQDMIYYFSEKYFSAHKKQVAL